MNIQSTSRANGPQRPARQAPSTPTPPKGEEQQAPRDTFLSKTSDFLLTTAIGGAPMVLGASFGLPGVGLGVAAHAGYNYLDGAELSRGMQNSVPMMLVAAGTSALFGTTTGIVASVAFAAGMATIHNGLFK